MTVRGNRIGCQTTQGHRIQQFRQPDTRLAGTAENRDQRAFGHRAHDQPRQFLFGRRRPFEVPPHHFFVDLDDRFEQRIVDFVRVEQRAAGVGRHLQRAEHTFERRAVADRHIQQHAGGAPHFADRVDQRREINVIGVHLVDHDDAAEPRLARLIEHAASVDFDARLSIDDDHRGVGAVHRADGLADEVGVARRIEHLEVLSSMIEVHELGFDRVLVVLLFRIEVADARPVIDTRMRSDRAGLHQHVVDERCLATPAVTTEYKIANVLNFRFRHCWNPLFPLSQTLSCLIFPGAHSMPRAHGRCWVPLTPESAKTPRSLQR